MVCPTTSSSTCRPVPVKLYASHSSSFRAPCPYPGHPLDLDLSLFFEDECEVVGRGGTAQVRLP